MEFRGISGCFPKLSRIDVDLNSWDSEHSLPDSFSLYTVGNSYL